MHIHIRSHLHLFLFIFLSYSVSAQRYETESKDLKGWTKETRIVYEDFKGQVDDQFLALNKKAGLLASAQIGTISTMDVPKKKRDWKRLPVKVYAAPFFFKTSSVTITHDEKELDKQRLYFDMAEVSTRMMRKEIERIQDSLSYKRSYKSIRLSYLKIKDNYCLGLGKLLYAYTYEVFIDKKDGAFEKWSVLIKEKLKEMDKYATNKADCYRLLKGAPMDQEYKQSKKSSSFMNCKN